MKFHLTLWVALQMQVTETMFFLCICMILLKYNLQDWVNLIFKEQFFFSSIEMDENFPLSKKITRNFTGKLKWTSKENDTKLYRKTEMPIFYQNMKKHTETHHDNRKLLKQCLVSTIWVVSNNNNFYLSFQ